ncbi:lipopolysaccharide heptosyltransferase II [Arenicella xantha]|uniref:lipopolysaccharide heptosyltransferase II n=1 Tax=Arenicella xantha TaxID=644221 RepID=A0A395JM70_9GAMM|nr:lipopolysaccharide heptosyltransferase II [Arenicella xantha]RBP48880.1 heptosyltransferase-2 [Arenicella xantha]
MSDSIKKYLIIGPSWVGDMVMAQSLFIDIKQREPHAHIDVLAPAWTAAIVDRMPQVSELVAANFNHGKLSLAERFCLGKALRSKGYTHAILLPNSLKSAIVPAVARIPVRTGWLGEQRWGLLNDIRRLDKQRWPMTVQRFIALGLAKDDPVRPISEVPAPLLEVDAESVAQVLKANALHRDKRILVLCPGAEFGPSKQWPAEHYASLARHYLGEGWQVWLMGSDKDLPTCQQISLANENQCEVLAGKTTLPQAVDLMSLASLVVSNDSGLMHIAAALQRPLVAIYGSTDPGHTPPLSANHVVARLGLDCSPCFKRECPLQHLNCLVQLSPEHVIKLSAAV